MKLHLKSSDTIQEMQQKFKAIFSHLKPEFFKKQHHDSGEYVKKEQYLHNITLAEILGHEEDIVIAVDKQMTTEVFERMFEEQYHLHVQILRLQKDNWLLTSNTQEMTLEAQNNKGIEADTPIETETIKDIDAE